MSRWTIAELLAQAATELRPVGPSARLDAEVLLADLLGHDRTWLLAHSETLLSDKLVATYATRLERRLHGWPVAYITGYQEFAGLSLQVNPSVLIPRPASGLLIESLLRHRHRFGDGIVVDIGTGSGALALAAASQLPRQPIVATDVSLPALRLAAANARYLGMPGRVDFRVGSLLEPVEAECLDVIIANLPYLSPPQLNHPSLRYEPRVALHGGADGLDLIRALLNQAADRPDWRGLIIEFDPAQTAAVADEIAGRWPDAGVDKIQDGPVIRGFSVWRDG